VELEIGAGITEYSLSGNSSSDRFGVVAGFAAGYFDLPVSSMVVPYIGLGLGIVGFPARDLGGSTGLAAFGEIGVSIPLSAGFDLVPGLRYAWLDAGGDYANADAGWLPKIALRFAF
jgi:hypothetical protein